MTIDELLSSERLLFIAENENKLNIQNMCDLLFSMVDVCFFMLMVLPLYPNTMEGYVYSVNLFAYTETAQLNRVIYWCLFISLIFLGSIKVALTKYKPEISYKMLTDVSVILNVLTVLFLALTREAYAVTVAFLLLIIKGILLLKYIQSNR